MGRYSYDSGASGLVQGYQLGTSIADRRKEAEMDEKVGAALARKAEVGGDTVYGAGEGLQTVDAGGNVSYDTAGGTVNQHKLGGLSRDTAFTPEEVRASNRQLAKDELGAYGKAGSARIAQMDAEDVTGLQKAALQRADTASKKELEDTTYLGSMRAKMAEAAPEDRAKLAAEYEADAFKRLGAKAVPFLTSDMQFATAKVNQQKEVAAAELLKAAETPQSMVDWANKKGMSVVLHESKDGRTYFVNDLNKDGKVSADEAGSVSSLGSFKTGDWVGEGRKLLVQHQPEIVDFAAKKDIEFEYAKKLQLVKNQGIKERSAAHAKDGTVVVGQVQMEDGEWAVAYKTKGGTSFTEDEDGVRTPIGEKEIVKTGAKAKDSDEIVEARGLQAGYKAAIEKDKDNKWFTGDREKAEAKLKASVEMYGDLSQKKGLTKQPATETAKPKDDTVAPAATKTRTQIPGAPQGYTTDGTRNFGPDGKELRKKAN